MLMVLRLIAWAVVIVVLLGALVWVFGPRTPVVTDVSFDEGQIDDVGAYFARVEADVPNLRDAARKRVVWAGDAGARTPISILYLHGFSASAEEVRPLPDHVARALGANLIFARLAGHGRDGPAMAEASVADWVRDLAEGMAAARKVGERVIILSTSTGGTLGVLATQDPVIGKDLAGIAFLSPNFRIKAPAAALLTWPLARHWVPLVTGETRSFNAYSPEHAAHWTTTYPTAALMPMAAMVAHAGALDFSRIDTPALFVFSPDDQVVDAARTEEIAAAWGGPVQVERITPLPGNAPDNHVIAGDILSPEMTEQVAEIITAWARSL